MVTPEEDDALHLPNPWPRKPPKGWRCDGEVECPTPEECAELWSRLVDPGGTIHIHKCQADAVETVMYMNRFESYLCAEHADKYESMGAYFRNPRRKRVRNRARL